MTGYSNDEAFFLGSSDLSPTFDLSSYESVCDLGGAEGTLGNDHHCVNHFIFIIKFRFIH